MTQTENTVAPAITARDIKGINTVGLYTLVRREVSRFLIVYAQTIVTPVVSTLLFYTIFALAFGGLEKEIGGIPFLQFLAPGLIMMSMVQNSFSNTSSSLIIAKVQGNIVDILMPPLSSAELLLGFLIGGLARGLAVGAASVLVMSLFLSLPLHSPGLLIL
ncbi:MAG: ABC transporter permease, partial [Alphaproteobacteria bacterium]|nr:ABC transporter permease [Alphaproteobacteria bacterium]